MKQILLTLCILFFYIVLGQAKGVIKTPETAIIQSPELKVTIDRTYPRILEYAVGAKKFQGAQVATNRILINGKDQNYKVNYRENGASGAAYDLSFPAIGLHFTLTLTVNGGVVEGNITNIKEDATKLYTVSFPAHQLLSVTAADKAPAYIWCRMIPMVDSPDIYSTLADAPVHTVPLTANYAFLLNGELSAGIVSNVIDERERIALQTQVVDGQKTASLWCPVWTYRELDTETLENPWFKIIITGDKNQDQRVDWQDAALVYRSLVKRPWRADEVKKRVSSQIGFNASHLAENPFLRMFDNMKKCALLIDFLPQDLLVKGYQGGGHDSSVPDYAHPNLQAGGFRDLNYMIDHGKEINMQVGLHINCTEAYPESRYFDPAILTNELGWLWGDQAVLIDKKKDLKSGKLFQRIDELFDSVPHIELLYVDTYQDRGWPLIKIREKLESYNQRMFTEFDVAMDGVATWSHGRVRLKDKISQFIWNDCRDIYRPNPLLFGSDHTGINGWEGEDNVKRFVKEMFTENLPTKFLQHFNLMSWTDEQAVFDRGVKTVRVGDQVTGTWGKMPFFQGTWNEKRRNFSDIRVFIPWEADEKMPERIFVWNETGGKTQQLLPTTWDKQKKVYLYQLTDRGRIFKTLLPVKNGTIHMVLEKEQPYVIYREKMPEINPDDMKWGEGQAIKDPGFNDYTLAGWNKVGDKKAVQVVVAPNGQTRLQIASTEKAGVSQRIKSLNRQSAYYISANVLINNGQSRKTTLIVTAFKGGKIVHTVSNYIDKTTLNGVAKKQRLKVLFDMPAEADEVEIAIVADPDAKNVPVWVDDVRAYQTTPVEKEENCLFSEDFELRDMGWGPFVNTVSGSIFTDLSELNPGRTADVIHGNFSLKTWNHKKGLIYRTTPGLLRLAPHTAFEMVFDYLCDRSGCYELVVKESDAPDSKELLCMPIKRGKSTLRGSFNTSSHTDAWIGIRKMDDEKVIFVMDDLKIYCK